MPKTKDFVEKKNKSMNAPISSDLGDFFPAINF